MRNYNLPQRAFAKAVPGCQKKGQDAASVLTCGGVTALAVADGVTSAGPYAHLGAQSAATAATRFLTEKFDEIVAAGEDRLRNYFFSYFRTYYLWDLNAAVENAGLPQVLEDTKAIYKHFRFYSTTIIACGIRDDHLVMMKIGNGSIVADAGTGFGVVSPSELVHGQTPCIERLYDPGFDHFSFRRYLVPNLTCLVLMSDGVEHTSPLLYDEINQRLPQNFPGWIQEATRTKESFSAAVEQLGRTGEDDVAVAVLVRGEADFSRKSLLQGNPFASCELYRLSATPARFDHVDQTPTLPAVALAPPHNPADSPVRHAIDVPGPGPELQELVPPTSVPVPPPKPVGSAPHSSIDVPVPGPELKQAQSVGSDGVVQLNTTSKETLCDEHFQNPNYEKINTHASCPSMQDAGDVAQRKNGETALAENVEPSDESIKSLEDTSSATDTHDQDSGSSRPKGTSFCQFSWDNESLLTALLLVVLAAIIALALLPRL